MISKQRRVILAAGLAMSSGTALAQFGGFLGGNKGSSGSGDFDTGLANFMKTSLGVEKTALQGKFAILAAYASEENRAKFQSMYQNVGKQTNPNEAGATFQAAHESSEAEMKKLSESKDLGEQTKKLDEQKKKLLAVGVSNFLIGALQAKDLLTSGQSIISGAASNPMNLSKISPVKDAVSRLSNAVSLASDAIPKFVDALKGANVSVAPVTATSKEASADF